MGQSQPHWRVVFRLETVRRDVACTLPHKSAASVNTSRERCDNFSITLGRRERCLAPLRLTGRAQGSAVYISSTATVSRHREVRGQRGGGGGGGRGVYASDTYQGLQGWCRSLLSRFRLSRDLHSFQWKPPGKDVEPDSAFCSQTMQRHALSNHTRASSHSWYISL